MSNKFCIEDMQVIAKKWRGKCLSQKYTNVQTKLEWQCQKKHTWWAKPADIRQGTWCPECRGTKKKTIEDMQKIAKKWKGKCRSRKYKNLVTKLKWECKKGHRWMATPDNIVQGHWCPECRGSKKCTIEQMQEIAASRGGECLSEIYKNTNAKLKWQCEQGHIWEAIPKTVKKGSWCPRCAGLKCLGNLKAKNLVL